MSALDPTTSDARQEAPAAPPEALRRSRRCKTTITKETLKAALRAAAEGREEVWVDAACPGLELRSRKGGAVAWTLRCMSHGQPASRLRSAAKPKRAPRIDWRQRRYKIGDHTVLPEQARQRGWQIKNYSEQGLNPDKLVVQLVTGASIVRQEAEAEKRGPKSWRWEAAREKFLAHVREKRTVATFKDYKNILENTPELARLGGQPVSSVTDMVAERIYADVAARGVAAHAEHVQRVLSSMWTWLARPLQREDGSGVQPYVIRNAKAPERDRVEIGDAQQKKTKRAPPPVEALGRAIAIAKSGALRPRESCAILLLAGSAQRRRTVAGMNDLDLTDHDDEIEWAIQPYFRKPSNKNRSSSPHRIPLIGFAARAARELKRITNQAWLFPAKATPEKAAQLPHMDQGGLTHLMSWLPGVDFPPHKWRAALASYGPEHLGWKQDDAKLVLDHLEGFEQDDTTAQHYNSDPQILKKRLMLKQWTDWLDGLAEEAIARDPKLCDREWIREQVFRRRYKESAWKAALARPKKNGRLPWSDPAKTAVIYGKRE